MAVAVHNFFAFGEAEQDGSKPRRFPTWCRAAVSRDLLREAV